VPSRSARDAAVIEMKRRLGLPQRADAAALARPTRDPRATLAWVYPFLYKRDLRTYLLYYRVFTAPGMQELEYGRTEAKNIALEAWNAPLR